MKKINTLISCISIAILASMSAGLHAEVIEIPLAAQGAQLQDVERPKTGMSTTQVTHHFGEPLSRTAAIGEPPISRWEYADYYVYFEYQHVIHSVLKHRPQPTN